MDVKEIKGVVECLLFVSDKPLALSSLLGLLETVDRRTLLAVLDELKAEYDLQGRAFQLVEIAEGYQLATRVAYAPWVRKLYKTKAANRLSKPALETLAIIAYRQPVTRTEIEDIRGVSADGVVNALLERKMIRIVGRKEVVGRPILYGTTKEFLHYFGLKDLSDMPALKDLQDILKQDDAGQAWELTEAGELKAKTRSEGQDAGGIAPEGTDPVPPPDSEAPQAGSGGDADERREEEKTVE